MKNYLYVCIKKISLLLLLLPLVIDASIAYISVLQNKNNPEKTIILLGDRHNFIAQQEQLQRKILDELLQYVRSIPQQELSKIDFLFECAPIHLESIDKYERFYKKAYRTDDLLSYISSLYAHNQLPPFVNSFACDIINAVDLQAGIIGSSLFGQMLPMGKFNSYKDSIVAELKFIHEKNIQQLKLGAKGPLYDAITNSPETIKSNFTYKPITIGDYLNRLNELIVIVQQKLQTIPQEFKSTAEQAFLTQVEETKKIIAKYNLDTNANIATLALHIKNASDNEKYAALEYWNLFNASTYARDIVMLSALLESQQKANISILYTGLAHTLAIEELLKKRYIPIYSADLIIDVEEKADEETKALVPPEEAVWEILNEIAQKVPLIKSIQENYKQNPKQ